MPLGVSGAVATATEAPPPNVPARRTYYTLDGIRAVAALLVMTRHVPMFFNAVALKTPETFLGVDLFYLISGFVIAHAYGARLSAGGNLWSFMTNRLIRLYPLYLVALALGALATAVTIWMYPNNWWTFERLTEALTVGLVLAPLTPHTRINGASLNGPTWTLLPELAANLLYAIVAPFLRVSMLAPILVLSGAALIYAEFNTGSLDVGYKAGEVWVGMARAAYSFFAGVTLCKLIGQVRTPSGLAAWLCVAAAAFALAFTPPAPLRQHYELAVVLFGFPALLTAAARFEPGEKTARLFAFLGAASYTIYLLHQPLGKLARLALHLTTPLPLHAGLAHGAVFLAVLLIAAYALGKYYDAPVRRLLTGKLAVR